MLRLHVSALAMVSLSLGCAREAPIAEVQGQCAEVYQGQVCTWARMRGAEVVAVGATVPVASIANAPSDEHMTWPPATLATLAIPEAAQQQTGLTELTMLWEATGHPPGPYLTPHFDFHFYRIPGAERVAIDCSDGSKPAALPAGYTTMDLPLPPPMVAMTGVDTLVGLCVPQMGMHSLLASELEGSELFRGSMVVGYYQGKPIFVEPMVTKAMLMESRSFDLPIPEIPGLVGAHPRTFRADYDSTAKAYHFVFSGFSPEAKS